MDDSRAHVEKYDRLAATYSTRYAAPETIAHHQIRMIRSWGRETAPGASVLELGCADGFVTEHLARAGFRVTAIDLSPGMIEAARQRLSRAGLVADLRVGDVRSLDVDGVFDVTAAFMWTFFDYAHDPVDVLRKLGAVTRQKLFVDVNPRSLPVAEAMNAVRDAGYALVDWRPFFVPQRFRVGAVGLGALRVAERIPGVRETMLRRKFVAIIKGERT